MWGGRVFGVVLYVYMQTLFSALANQEVEKFIVLLLENFATCKSCQFKRPLIFP